MARELSKEEILALLKTSRRSGPRKDPTEPRNSKTWFEQFHELGRHACENPECVDPRPTTDSGRNVTALIKEKHMCRFCFLRGWLSDGSK